MVRKLYCAVIACLVSTSLFSQTSSRNYSADDSASTVDVAPAAVAPMRPFLKVAFGGGIGIMGVNLQAATNVTRNSNVRLSGNVFSYTVSDITSNGFAAGGKLDFATMNASFDYYPWANHGFRLSPGFLLYNQNSLSVNGTVSAGQTFTLNDVTYYSSGSDPIRATAKVGLNGTNPAFTVTTGWGNMIPRRGGHWSFPFELGAAFTGSPTFNMALTGTACDRFRLNCVNAATNPTIQSNLNAQIDKYKKDVDGLKIFPMLSFGVSYAFGVR